MAAKLKGPFNPKAKLDPRDVVDLRMPAPMDVYQDTWSDPGRSTGVWEPSVFPGGISYDPHRVLVRPGPNPTTYFPPGSPANKPLPDEQVKRPKKSGGRVTTPNSKQRKIPKTGLKTYAGQVK